jgi:hypothetical protein
MKLTIRITALSLVVAASVAGNSLPSNSARSKTHIRAVSSATPLPMCNPFEKACPPIR